MKPYVWSALSVHTHGLRPLDNVTEPFVVIANHSSHLDANLIFGALPRRLSRNLSAGAAADYFFNHKLRALGTRMFYNAYPIDRGGRNANRRARERGQSPRGPCRRQTSRCAEREMLW